LETLLETHSWERFGHNFTLQARDITYEAHFSSTSLKFTLPVTKKNILTTMVADRTPSTPVYLLRPRVAYIDLTVLQMDRERRMRREGIKRAVFNENQKRAEQPTASLIDQRKRSSKRQCLEFGRRLDKENIFETDQMPPLGSSDDIFGWSEDLQNWNLPFTPRTTLVSSLRPRDLQSGLNVCRDRSESFDSMVSMDLLYMPL
jgi:hypothetical protein